MKNSSEKKITLRELMELRSDLKYSYEVGKSVKECNAFYEDHVESMRRMRNALNFIDELLSSSEVELDVGNAFDGLSLKVEDKGE